VTFLVRILLNILLGHFHRKGLKMKKNLFCIFILLILIKLPSFVSAIEVQDLPPEKAAVAENKASLSIQGYANSKNVVVMGSVIGATYHFCNKPMTKFCSDFEGILIISAADTGKIPQMLKALDRAVEGKEKVMIKFSTGDHFLGVREIVDVLPVKSTI